MTHYMAALSGSWNKTDPAAGSAGVPTGPRDTSSVIALPFGSAVSVTDRGTGAFGRPLQVTHNTAHRSVEFLGNKSWVSTCHHEL